MLQADDWRATRAVEVGQEAFWRAVAERYPEITTGDVDPIAHREFEEACRRAVAGWIRGNRPIPYSPERSQEVLRGAFAGKPWRIESHNESPGDHGTRVQLTEDSIDGPYVLVTCGYGHDESEGWEVGGYKNTDEVADGNVVLAKDAAALIAQVHAIAQDLVCECCGRPKP